MPSWLRRNNASISTAVLLSTLLSMIVSVLTGNTPLTVTNAAASQHISFTVSPVDMRPLEAFEKHHMSSAPVASVVQVQTTALQSTAPASAVIKPGSNLSKEAAELGGDWTWQKLCALTNPALADCSKVPAGTVIVLNGPTHALPSAPVVVPAAPVVAKPAPVQAVPTTAVVSAPALVQTDAVSTASYSCDATPLHKQWMAAAGIAPSNCFFVNFIMNHESGWCPTVNNGERGCTAYHGVTPDKAYGVGQSKPGSNMTPFGADWRTNPVTQLRWANWYAEQGHYKSWASAYNHWVSNSWW